MPIIHKKYKFGYIFENEFQIKFSKFYIWIGEGKSKKGSHCCQ